ncbi:hypothetical protein ACQP00_36630 [Dactylosporangium sp. CS-047395]|uniref:hypothetical protein n=1 Tax=Dactylosporangium sp. CS-047395 TaxID=3239936 RepID=UPI003D901801
MSVTLRAVVDVPGGWLTLDGSCGADEVGLFAAVVADYNNVTAGELVAEEHLIAPGGLVLDDGVTAIVPGCCCGLEEWREWVRAVRERWSPGLGHDPTPLLSFGERTITVWQDTGPQGVPPVYAGPHIELTPAHLAELLGGVHRDLVAFHGRLARWGGADLAAHLDEAFAFTAPLGL